MKRFFLCLLAGFFLWTGIYPVNVWAAESDFTDSFLQELNLEEIDETLGGLLNKEKYSFTDAVKKLISGEIPISAENIKEIVWSTLFSEIDLNRQTAIQILILVTVAAVFTNFASVFEKSQVSDISFYMMYLLMFTLLMKAFQSLSQMTMDALNQVLTFMKLLVPSYFLASAFASGSLTGAGFYEFTLILIMVIQWILKYAVIPAVNLYVLFSMLNYLTKEEYLSKMAELLKVFVEWALKTLAAAAIGLQTVQCLILPAIDSLKTAVMNKTAGAIPGVGNIFSGVTEVILGSAVLIKNAVGVAGLILLFAICLIPFIKLGFSTLMYKLLAAVIQPVSDKRMMECISSVGEGAGLLMRVLLTIGVLFFISLAMATATIG